MKNFNEKVRLDFHDQREKKLESSSHLMGKCSNNLEHFGSFMSVPGNAMTYLQNYYNVRYTSSYSMN